MKSISVFVKPGSKKGDNAQLSLDGSLVIHTSARAVEGSANKRVIELVADFYNTSKTLVSIKSGHTSRKKIINIEE